MHITNKKIRFDIFTVGNSLNIFMEHIYLIPLPNYFWHKRKIYHFDPYNVFVAIATNIPQGLKTAFVLQGHTCPRQSEELFLLLFFIIII